MKLSVPVIGILRGVEPGFFPQLLRVSYQAGLQALEVTMNTPGAPEMLRQNMRLVPDGCLLGMGTVCNLAEAKVAIDAGAMFLVTPNTDVDVIAYAKQQGVPIVSGALTPTEVYQAYSAGADMVKVFPCPGPKYIKDLLGPMQDVPLVAVGGVKQHNLNEFLSAGAVAVGVGNSLFGEDALSSKDADGVLRHMSEYLKHIA